MSYNIYNATTDSLEKVSGRVSNGILNTLSEVKESASENVASGSLAVKELAECNDYSTEEQVIGTWNGKTLYRKILIINSPSSANANTVVYTFPQTIYTKFIIGTLTSGSDLWGIPSFSNTSYFINIWTSSAQVKMNVSNAAFANKQCNIVVEYTKD